jgi:hypothetical protein
MLPIAMPRGLRVDASDLLRYVMVRGLERRALLRDGEDRRTMSPRERLGRPPGGTGSWQSTARTSRMPRPASYDYGRPLFNECAGPRREGVG